MASLKAIRKRITSVKSTQKITKAMKMVDAAKLRRAQEAATAARPYAEKLAELLRNVAARVGTDAHPLLQARPEEHTLHVVLVTADRGLCGGYNTNLIRKADALLRERGRERVRMTVVGRRGFDFFKKRNVNIVDQQVKLFSQRSADMARAIGDRVAREFADGVVDGVQLIFSHFRSVMVQAPTVLRLLPIAADTAGAADTIDYLYEPNAADLLDRLLRRYVTVQIYRAFLEAAASEHAARMTAMDSATSNAADMIDRLTLEMNRARQASITKELMEIIGGAEALKG